MSVDVYPPLDIIAQPPAVTATLWRSSVQSVPSGVETAVVFDQAVKDSDGMWNPATPTRLTIRTPGSYVFHAFAEVGTGAAYYVAIRKNGTTLVAVDSDQGDSYANETFSPVSAPVDMVAGDYVELLEYHTAGSNRDLGSHAGSTGTPRKPTLSAHLLAGNANGAPSGSEVERVAAHATIANATWVPITWDRALVDTDALWVSATPTRLYARKTGWYAIAAQGRFVASASGIQRQGAIFKNDTGDQLGERLAEASGIASGTQAARMNPATIAFLRAGEWVEFRVHQDTGGNLGLNTRTEGTHGALRMSMVCITGTTVSTRQPPFARVRRTSQQTVTAAAWQPMVAESARWDTDAMFDPTVGGLRIRTPGLYDLSASLNFNAAVGGVRYIGIEVNGSTVAMHGLDAASVGSISTPWWCSAGDVVKAIVYSTLANTLPAYSVGPYENELSAVLREPISAAALMTPEAFHLVGAAGEPGFANGWTNYGTFSPASFWKDPFGMVHLRGLIKSGTHGVAAFVLPLGYRPAVLELLGTISNSTTGRIDVDTAGNVIPQAAQGSNAWVALNQSFRAA